MYEKKTCTGCLTALTRAVKHLGRATNSVIEYAYLCLIGFCLLSQMVWANALLDDPTVQDKLTRLPESLTTELRRILVTACQQAIQSRRHLDITSAIPSTLYDFDEQLAKDFKYACECLTNSPAMYGTLYAASYMKQTLGEAIAANQFLTVNMQRIARQCVWLRTQNAVGNYESYFDKQLQALLGQCQSNYTQVLLDKRKQGGTASVDDVLQTGTSAEKTCQCVLNSSMVRGVSTIAIEFLTNAFTGSTDKDVGWQQHLLAKRLKEQSVLCGIKRINDN